MTRLKTGTKARLFMHGNDIGSPLMNDLGGRGVGVDAGRHLLGEHHSCPFLLHPDDLRTNRLHRRYMRLYMKHL